MAFCQFSTETIASNTTNVDNLFINEFLPYANDTCVKVYLYGLSKCYSPNTYDNTLSSFSKVLGLDEDDILSAYLYWQEQGLVQVLSTEPFEVVYQPIKNAISNTKKYNKTKYNDFNVMLETIFKGRELTLNEYYQYYEFMEVYHMEPEALLLIIEYCARAKGNNIRYNYILTIAKSWAHDGYLSLDKVDLRLKQLEQNSTEVGDLFSYMQIKRVATLDEKELLQKWKTIWGYDVPTIIEICKLYKKKGQKIKNLEKLDTILLKYYEMKLTSVKEITSFEKEKESLNKLSISICKNLGLYYENIEPVSSNYTQKWVLMGYSDEVLVMLANYCFKTSIKTLEGMNTIVNKFFKLGMVSEEAINQYLDQILASDNKIQSILESLGLLRNVNKLDRDFYNIWTQDWGFTEDILNYAISLSKDKYNPMQYLNKLLSSYHSSGVKTLEDCKKVATPTTTTSTTKPTNQNYTNRNYSSSDLNALFDNLEEIDL